MTGMPQATAMPPDPAPTVQQLLAFYLEAGVDCGVLMAPVLPGLSDSPEQLAEVADACKAVGVRPGGPVPLHLVVESVGGGFGYG